MEGRERGGAPPPLGGQDLHVHTTMSDGSLTLEAVVGIAAERGIAVGIADHVSARNLALFVSDGGRLDRYILALAGVDVFRSAELCWRDPFSASLSPELAGRFDYLIGSNHGFELPGGAFASPWTRALPRAWAERPDDVMEVMVENLCEMVAVMPIEIAAHPTLMPQALLSLESDVHAWWTEAREDRFIEAAVASGVALEISNRYRLPHDRFLRKAKEAGAAFTLGSDGHTLDQVLKLDWAVSAAERAGIIPADLFLPTR